jgi:hypothetical protein
MMALHGDGTINRNFNCWTEAGEDGKRDTYLKFHIISGVIVEDGKLLLDDGDELGWQLEISKYHLGWHKRGGSGYHQKISGLFFENEDNLMLEVQFPVEDTIQTSSINPVPKTVTRTLSTVEIKALASGLDPSPLAFILWPSNSIRMWNDETIDVPLPNTYKAPMLYQDVEYEHIYIPSEDEEDDSPPEESIETTVKTLYIDPVRVEPSLTKTIHIQVG